MKMEKVTLHVGLKGFLTQVYDWCLDNERDMDSYDWEPNVTWFSVELFPQDVERYLTLWNLLLEIENTPNIPIEEWDELEFEYKKSKKELSRLEP